MSLFKHVFHWKKTRNPSSTFRRRYQRRLLCENLESRQLLAADLFHNHFDPEDVNDDGFVSPIDALAVVNAINSGSESNAAGMFTDVNNDGRQSAIDALMVAARLGRSSGADRTERNSDQDGTLPAPVEEFREIDGSGNNLENASLGSAGETLIRIAEADYSDGISQAAGIDRPSARAISNLLSDVGEGETSNDRNLTAFLYVWGQFLDHDIDLSLTQHGEADVESLDIEIPIDDGIFNPQGADDATIPFVRSVYDASTGTSEENPRQQLNAITAFIDGSQIYGSDQTTADALREFQGGRLLMDANGLLPKDPEGNVLAGDIRAAENVSLTSMHALFVREHNRLADLIASDDPTLSDEEIYQQARAIVVAQLQSITYNEFLPALLGRQGLESYRGYDASIDPSIANEFSTAAYRFGHSTLNNDIEFFGNDGLPVAEEIALPEAFFNASLLEETGIDSLLKYNASSLAQEIDLEVVDGLRNFLFGPPGAGGLDLVALNIQRGRDHGLSDYNTTRTAYGLEAYESFAELTSDTELQENLATLYGDIDNIDLWVGLLAEDHEPGSSMGELAATIIGDQFTRLRDGDRFYYENIYSERDQRLIEETSLADIIERNTSVSGLQDNVFFFRAQIRGTVTMAPSPNEEAQASLARSEGSRGERDARNRRDREEVRREPVAGVTIELLDEQGEVVDTTITNRQGNYRFQDFDETGLYQVRVADSGQTLEVLISTGNQLERGFDFELV